ncbi:hypothetical protein L596_022686 [Steinernema carpocapsae]|uniref:Peptidase M1 membrane alanine aminopeptidase domain-containing protein n=1 Tax=Steinernema carpocapsae TaxID=34508 RepID=A0A4U5MMH3_STECR|nr:hypothetical protein L596_022686 [Steinernema carpocapsae]
MWLLFSLVLLWMSPPLVDSDPYPIFPLQYHFTLTFENLLSADEYSGIGTLTAHTQEEISNFTIQFNQHALFDVDQIIYREEGHEPVEVNVLEVDQGKNDMGPYRLVLMSSTVPNRAKMDISYHFTIPVGRGPEDGIYRRISPKGGLRVITHFKDNKGVNVLPMLHSPMWQCWVQLNFICDKFKQGIKVFSNVPMVYNEAGEIYSPAANFPVPSYGVAFIMGQYNLLASNDSHRRIELYSDIPTSKPVQQIVDVMADAYKWLQDKIKKTSASGTIKVFIIDDEEYDEVDYRGPQSYTQIIFMPNRFFEKWFEAPRANFPYSREQAQFEFVRAIFQQWFFFDITLASWKNIFIADGLSAKFALDYFYESRFSRKIDPMAWFLEDKLNDILEMDTVQNPLKDMVLYDLNAKENGNDFDRVDNIFSEFKTVALLRQMEHFGDKQKEFYSGVSYFMSTYKNQFWVRWTPEDFLDCLNYEMSTVPASKASLKWFTSKYYPVVQVDGYFVECKSTGCLQEGAIMQKLYVPFGIDYKGGDTFPLPMQFTLVPRFGLTCNLTSGSIFLTETILKTYDVTSSQCKFESYQPLAQIVRPLI